MKDYQAEQFVPRTPCASKDCAAATTAMDVFFGTRGEVEMSHVEVRNASGVSCVPGKDTPSGGLNVAAIEDVCRRSGVTIDFHGTLKPPALRRWTETEIRTRLGTFYGGHLLGMYSSVKAPWRAHGSTFQGGHSVFCHDYREDMEDSHFDKVQPTYCWHDPLRPRPIRVPASVVTAYTQSNTPLKGYAGFVRIPALGGATYADPMTDRTRVRYKKGAAVHDKRTTGAGSTTRIIKPKGTLVEIAMYANGEPYGTGPNRNRWGALSLLGDEWVHLNRLNHVGGTT